MVIVRVIAGSIRPSKRVIVGLRGDDFEQTRRFGAFDAAAGRAIPDRAFCTTALVVGDAPDLDAMVEAYLDRKAGITPSENLYQSRRKRGRDAAILVLTDTSLSTDGYSNNQRVLDLEMRRW